MIIKELKLIGFGKFKDKELPLDEGINLIYGENEAGKSTLHSFIHGIFYGFLKPDARKSTFTGEYDRYRPWDKSRYAGILRFIHEDKEYRIERDFSKGKGTTRIIDENTGQDIIKDIDTGKSIKVPQPGIHFFGLNTREFSNTVFIKQLSMKTEGDLATDLREKITNLSSSLDEGISIDKAIAGLGSKMAEIGTERAPTKPYARNIKEIERLEGERDRLLAEKEDYEQQLAQKDSLEENIRDERNKLAELNEILQDIGRLEKMKKLEKASLLSREIEDLKKVNEELSSFRHLCQDEYGQALDLSNDIKILEGNMKYGEDELADTLVKLEILHENQANLETASEGFINMDYNVYEELEEEKNSIIYSGEGNKLDFLKKDQSGSRERSKKFKNIQFLSVFLLIFSLTLTIKGLASQGKYLPMLALTLGFALLGIYNMLKYGGEKKILRGLEEEISALEEKEEERKNRIREIEIEQANILEKNGVSGKLEFKRLLDGLQREYDRLLEHKRKYEELELKRSVIEEKVSREKGKWQENKNKLVGILGSNRVENLDEFRLGLEKKTLYEKNIIEMGHKEEKLNSLLAARTLEDLRQELEGLDLDKGLEDVDKEELMGKISDMEDRIIQYEKDLAGLVEKIKLLVKDIEKLVEAEEELDRREEDRQEMEGELMALELAAKIIGDLSKEIHSEFAPKINRRMGDLIQKITRGKYSKIRADEALNIRVENPETGELVKLEDLSGGTIDQLYFSLRYSIIDSMYGHNLPLILDDSFLQYDDTRLGNIMDFLIEEGKKRQIILFTCHKREEEIMKKKKAEYKLINLA
ncbi:MAG: AAA family ATPase [Tissierellaceae bacterium]